MDNNNLPVEINPDYYSDAVKHQCFILYCNGLTPKQIAENTGIATKDVNKWVWKEDWPSLRDDVQLRYKDILIEHSAIDILGTQAKHTRLARMLQQFAEEEMLKQLDERSPSRRFRNWNEVSQVLQAGINMEKQAVIGNIEEEFVLKLVNAIRRVDMPDEHKEKIIDAIKSVFNG